MRTALQTTDRASKADILEPHEPIKCVGDDLPDCPAVPAASKLSAVASLEPVLMPVTASGLEPMAALASKPTISTNSVFVPESEMIVGSNPHAFSSLKNAVSGHTGGNSSSSAEINPSHSSPSDPLRSALLPESQTGLATKQETQLEHQMLKERALSDKKRAETEHAARRAAAIKRREEAEDRRQNQQETLCREPPAQIHEAPVAANVLEAKCLTPGPEENKSRLKLAKSPLLKPISPIDTYEISDREESTDDDDDENGDRKHKHMPTWASGMNLREALRAQANSDPSAVFAVGASSCDLKNIFKTDRAFKKRTSSQNWGMDLSTQVERQKYRAEMGFTPPK